jgi:cathepsin L
MEKTSLILLALTIIATIGVFNYAPETETQSVEEIYQYKIEFTNFMFQFNKKYDSQEQAYRFKIFKDNLIRINKHNKDSAQTYLMGINQFTDMTQDEFIQQILVNNMMDLKTVEAKKETIEVEAPTEVDWRNKGVMTAVKNQGQCGSCWSFSTTATLESSVAIAKKNLYSFSEQQLVDCCGAKGFQCQGCSGAWPEWAFNYINSAGIVLETEYPYTAKNGACKATPTAKKFLNSAKPWSMLSGTESIKSALAATGPISICVDASNWSAYRSGVFSNCGTTTLNHAVTLVGYQADGTWIVRNSWGTSWGEQGFIRLGTGGTCGLDKHALIPNLA